jgi:predicted lipoprotein
MITKINAIVSLVPNAEVTIQDNIIEWHNPSVAPVTDAQIEAEISRLQAEYDAKQYQRNRAKEYPSIADQLDKIFHDGIDEWKETIQAVKDKYPKS